MTAPQHFIEVTLTKNTQKEYVCTELVGITENIKITFQVNIFCAVKYSLINILLRESPKLCQLVVTNISHITYIVIVRLQLISSELLTT